MSPGMKPWAETLKAKGHKNEDQDSWTEGRGHLKSAWFYVISRLSGNTQPRQAERLLTSWLRGGEQGSGEVGRRAAEVGGTEEELGGQQGGSLGSWRLVTEQPAGRATSSTVGSRAVVSSSGCLWVIFRGAFS